MGKRIAQLTGAIGGAIQDTMKLRLEENLRNAALKRMAAQQEAEDAKFRFSENLKAKRHKEILGQRERIAKTASDERIEQGKKATNRFNILNERKNKEDQFREFQEINESLFVNPLKALERRRNSLRDPISGFIDLNLQGQIDDEIKLLKANQAKFLQTKQTDGLTPATTGFGGSFEGIASSTTDRSLLLGNNNQIELKPQTPLVDNLFSRLALQGAGTGELKLGRTQPKSVQNNKSTRDIKSQESPESLFPNRIDEIKEARDNNFTDAQIINFLKGN